MYQGSTLYDIRKTKVKQEKASTPAAHLGIGSDVSTVATQGVIRITPEEARALLSNVHPRQRKLSGARVHEYLRSMQAGQWHEPPFTFDSIAFDADGQLCNGLHRLTALAQYDKPLSFFVIIGVKSPDDMPLPEGDNNMARSKAFVAGIDRNTWAVVAYLAEWVHGKSPARVDVQTLYPLFAEAINATPRVTVRPPAAPIRAAFVFSYAQASSTVHRQAIAEQWHAYCKLEVGAMWPSIARLYKKMQTLPKMSGGGSDRNLRFESAMYAIDHPESMRINRQEDAGQRVADWIAAKRVAK